MTRALSLLVAALLVVGVLAILDRPTHAADPVAPDAGKDAAKPAIKALLVIGGCCHDYKNQGKILSEGIAARANVEWTVAYDPDGSTKHLNPVYENPDWAKGFDVIVHDECSADVTDLATIDRILKPHREGVPAVLLHCAMHSYRSEGFPDKNTPWFEFTGLATTGHGPHLPLTFSYTDADHPITQGLQGWTTGNEELYNNIRPLLPGTHALATGKQEGQQDAVTVWTNEYGPKKTKVFATTLGHNNEMVGDPRYLDLITRGLLWSVGKLDDQHFKPVKAEANVQENAKLASTDAKDEPCCEAEGTTARVQ